LFALNGIAGLAQRQSFQPLLTIRFALQSKEKKSVKEQ